MDRLEAQLKRPDLTDLERQRLDSDVRQLQEEMVRGKAPRIPGDKKTDPTDTKDKLKPLTGAVAKPTSRAEFDKLPKGAKYVNPADGKTYIKN